MCSTAEFIDPAAGFGETVGDRFRRHRPADLTELLREADSRRCQDFRKHRWQTISVVYLEQHPNRLFRLSVWRLGALLRTAPVHRLDEPCPPLNRSFPVETSIKLRPLVITSSHEAKLHFRSCFNWNDSSIVTRRLKRFNEFENKNSI